VTETKAAALARFDWIGFSALSIAIGALQLFLDRGAQLDWFDSPEILIEAAVCVAALYVLIVHTFTAENSFIKPRMFLDRNFTVGLIFIFLVGISYLASLALLTPYLQTLLGYPVVTAGIIMGPRGLGTMACMFIVGRLIGKVDTRLLLGAGFLVSAWAMYDMAGWTPDVPQSRIMLTGFVQGGGLGLLFVPLTTVTFVTLPARYRGDGTGLYNLSRNIGSSVGISLVAYLLTRNLQVNHAEIATYVTPFNRLFELPAIRNAWDPTTLSGRAALDEIITRQAMIIAYADDFKLLMILSLAAMPFLALLRTPGRQPEPAGDHAVVME
jgi:DHA2 family multidrug resistance protein